MYNVFVFVNTYNGSLMHHYTLLKRYRVEVKVEGNERYGKACNGCAAPRFNEKFHASASVNRIHVHRALDDPRGLLRRVYTYTTGTISP